MLRVDGESVSHSLVTLEVVVDGVGEGMDLFFLELGVPVDSIVLLERLLTDSSVFILNGDLGLPIRGELTLARSIGVDVLQPADGTAGGGGLTVEGLSNNLFGVFVTVTLDHLFEGR